MKLKHFSMKHFGMFKLFAPLGAGGGDGFWLICARRRKRR
jgi:hypothetical protein